MVVLHTNFGPIKIELYPDKAPQTVENFLNYAKSGHYDGTIFHRVIKGFVVQGGGYEAGFKEKEGQPPIENEAKTGISNKVGTLAMARTSDPHSATSQFFINVNDNLFLDHQEESLEGWGYCAFGKVTEGLENVKKMSEAETTEKDGFQDVPKEDAVLERVEILEDK